MKSKKENNITRVINDLIYEEGYYTKGDSLRVVRQSTTDILDRGLIIGTFVEGYCHEVAEYLRFLVLDLVDYKSDPLRTKHRKQLAKAANENGIYVIFVPRFDIGFGSEPIKSEYNRNYEYLLKVAKFSPDKDIKTAAMLIERKPDLSGDILCLTYNQYDLENNMAHAEYILSLYYKLSDYTPTVACVSMYEPCVQCIKSLLSINTDTIFWSEPHKAKWNTEEYIQFTNDIWIGRIKSNENHKVTYLRCEHKKVTHFYDKVLRGDKTK